MNNDEFPDENIEEIGEQSNIPKGNPVSNFIKDPLNTLKKGINGVVSKINKKRNKISLKEIWGRIPLKIKLIIFSIIFLIVVIICIINAISNNSTKAATKTRENAIKKFNISSQNSSITDQTALELYKNYDSLLAFNTDQLNSIYQEFLKNDSNDNKYLLESATREFGNDDGDKYSYNGKRSLYEHILRTEKYNFNKILWKGYTHTTDNFELETEKKESLEVIIPKGIDDETLNTLFKTASPYLLTQDIPLGILCGTIGQSSSSASIKASVSQKFTYQVLKESLTRLTINKYELDSIKYETTHDDYKYVTYTQKYYINRYSNGYEEIVSEGEPVKVSETDNETTQERKVEGTEQHSYDVYWYPAEAITYDAKITNNFNYIKYNDTDVQNIQNPDSNTLVQTVEINQLDRELQAKNVNNSGSKPLKSDGSPEAPVATNEERTYKYVKKEGYTYIYEKEWQDKLTAQSSEYKSFTADTAKEYNTTSNLEYSNFETDKVLLTEEQYSEKNTKIFEKYVQEDTTNKLFGMSLIDLLDSNSGIYNKYLNNGENLSEFEGIGRTKLKPAYYQIKNILNSLISKNDNNGETSGYNFNANGNASEKTLPFVYGASLGYKITSTSSSSSGVASGMDLLKQYLRKNEGHEGIADENKNRISDKDIDQAKYYIVGEVWNGKKYTRTVGYGVDLDTSGYEPEIMAAMGTTEKFKVGDMIPVEIVDKCEEDEISKAIDAVNAEFSGIELKEYQIHALVSRYYNCGVAGWKWEKYSSSNMNITQAYQSGWNEERDDKYEALYAQYKDNQTAKNEIVSNVDYENTFYKSYMSTPTNGGLLTTRRQSEWILFSTGYYDSLQRFWSNAQTPGGIDLYNSDGSINEGALAELTDWFVDNFFGGSDMMRFSGTGGFDKKSSNHFAGVTINTTDYPFFNNGLETYQCTWWARSRASYQAFLMDSSHLGSYIHTSGNGKDVAKNTASYYGVTLNTDVTQIKPNSIVSYNEGSYRDSSGNICGHVAFVEAVDYDKGIYYQSHCGGGTSWYGITIKYMKDYQNSSKFAGSVAIEDIVNSAKYQGGNN